MCACNLTLCKMHSFFPVSEFLLNNRFDEEVTEQEVRNGHVHVNVCVYMLLGVSNPLI